MVIRVLLVGDHPIMRKGLASLLEKEPDLQVAGEAGNGRKAVELARSYSPDIVTMDISMLGLSGVEAAHEILAEKPEIKLIPLTMHSSKAFVMRMLKAGARGYVHKDCAFDEVLKAIRAVSSGRTYLLQISLRRCTKIISAGLIPTNPRTY